VGSAGDLRVLLAVVGGADGVVQAQRSLPGDEGIARPTDDQCRGRDVLGVVFVVLQEIGRVEDRLLLAVGQALSGAVDGLPDGVDHLVGGVVLAADPLVGVGVLGDLFAPALLEGGPDLRAPGREVLLGRVELSERSRGQRHRGDVGVVVREQRPRAPRPRREAHQVDPVVPLFLPDPVEGVPDVAGGDRRRNDGIGLLGILLELRGPLAVAVPPDVDREGRLPLVGRVVHPARPVVVDRRVEHRDGAVGRPVDEQDCLDGVPLGLLPDAQSEVVRGRDVVGLGRPVAVASGLSFLPVFVLVVLVFVAAQHARGGRRRSDPGDAGGAQQERPPRVPETVHPELLRSSVVISHGVYPGRRSGKSTY